VIVVKGFLMLTDSGKTITPREGERVHLQQYTTVTVSDKA